ncbi:MULTISPECIES: hypothetical protein [Pseudomonas]|uniref:hypothetical protein n=1 Tax=Pseudomonas TaxID=286 RepID=UPI00287C7436|nr:MULTISPECIES: hypothetical protein [Pseudomonas]MDS9592409.1 hypothetical protein [Pseudomonas sp. HTZ1]WQE93238.1 hypothetical protein URF95_34740 [Pseudomonas aeruginosa]HBO6811514.1 hypothetical protein [Pseudomonas aeruginosa]
MDIHKHFKTLWWLALLALIGYYLFSRLDKLQSGTPSWFDALAFVVWVALSIGPFYSEIELPGVKLKKEVTQLKENMSAEIASIKSSIQQSNDQRQITNIGFPLTPAPDSKLHDIGEAVKRAVSEYMSESGEPPKKNPTEKHSRDNEDIPDDAKTLFAGRYALESRIREIYRPYAQNITNRKEPINRIIRELAGLGILPQELVSPIMEIYAICSAAIHGEDTTPAKVRFVQETIPELTTALDAISANLELKRYWSSPKIRAGIDATALNCTP